jgi:D-alanyl-D-alanine carboxypeptidase/D-alanyl-D-alanine-endopeptidase (penicillin-binding protein 4)
LQNAKAFIYHNGLLANFTTGWWDDYSAYYMVERSALPVYGNVIRWNQTATTKENPQFTGDTVDIFISSEPEVSWPITFSAPDPQGKFSVNRDRDANRITITEGKEKSRQVEVPFVTDGIATALTLLKDTIYKEIVSINAPKSGTKSVVLPRNMIYSQPVDSMLKPMMYRSDNFFAEQTLLMASNEHLGYMNDEKIILDERA